MHNRLFAPFNALMLSMLCFCMLPLRFSVVV